MAGERANVPTLDAVDPLATFRAQFQLRDGLLYFNGNSLGALPRATGPRLAQVVAEEWGEGLTGAWNSAGWVTAARRVGDKIAPLIGAAPGEVIAGDSTSINLFKALTAALSLRPGRHKLLSERGNFPTDLYLMQGIEAFGAGRCQAIAVEPEAVIDALDDDVAVLLLTQVHYKTGRMRDMTAVTRAAHERGVLIVWDLSHSAGAVPVDLNGAGADLAVGCGYKFLNGGPGAPGFLFVAERHQAATPVLSGWFGHARPFAFEDEYAPAAGIDRFQCGTPPILGLAALEIGVELMAQADMVAVRRKSLALGELLIAQMAERCAPYGFTLVSPTDPAERGSQVSYAHPNAYEIVQALKARDVITDFRAPDVIRFGLTPLYQRYQDVDDAVARLQDICATRAWDRPDYRERAAVT